MKRLIKGVIIMIIVVFAANEVVYGIALKDKDNQIQKSLSQKLIRFHVLANSDSDEDQKLKLKVRDEVLKFMKPKLDNSKSIQESRKILQENDKAIIEIAEKVIKENGYSYNVKTQLSRENFPVKTYGNITLPEGNYEAYRILIGKAEGKNWWCVMFPPLCFIDITKGEVSEKQTTAEMKKVLNGNELDYINNDSKVELRFKILDIIDKIIK